MTRWMVVVASLWLSFLASGEAAAQPLRQKLNAYVECTNRLSARAYESRQRYFSWAAKSGPTGKERIIYGTYTIYETANCRKAVEAANAIEPRDAELEAAASAYVAAVTTLEPLLKEADDYYTQQNYKDDRMAKGKALHPRLVAAWNAFAKADSDLRQRVDSLADKLALDKVAEIEAAEGRKARWHIEALMLRAKTLIRVHNEAPPNLARIQAALTDYEAIIQATETFADANKETPNQKIGSSFVGSAKSFLTTSKALMRRIRDKVAYSQGERMIMNTGAGAWMVEGSPARMTRDYNQLVDAYNRGPTF